MLDRALIGKKHGRGRDDLHIDGVPIHVVKPHLRVPAGRGNVAEESIAHHDLGFAGLRVLDPGPVGSSEAGREVGPGARKEVVVNIDDRHFFLTGLFHGYCLPG